MMASERVESIRARGQSDDEAHLLRMYDEALRVNVGLLAENIELKRLVRDLREGE